jgi:hypothetical protein
MDPTTLSVMTAGMVAIASLTMNRTMAPNGILLLTHYTLPDLISSASQGFGLSAIEP